MSPPPQATADTIKHVPFISAKPCHGFMLFSRHRSDELHHRWGWMDEDGCPPHQTAGAGDVDSHGTGGCNDNNRNDDPTAGDSVVSAASSGASRGNVGRHDSDESGADGRDGNNNYGRGHGGDGGWEGQWGWGWG